MNLPLTSPSFRHGIHPEEYKKATECMPVERMPFTNRYILPLSQHTGAPVKPIVRPGESVKRGQLIAEPGAFVSMTLHSPVTGTVKSIGAHRHPNGQLQQAIEIEADPFATQKITPKAPLDWRSMSKDEFVKELVQRHGSVN